MVLWGIGKFTFAWCLCLFLVCTYGKKLFYENVRYWLSVAFIFVIKFEVNL